MLVTYKEAAQELHTTVHALYQLRLKDKRPFPKKGMVDVEWFDCISLLELNDARLNQFNHQ